MHRSLAEDSDRTLASASLVINVVADVLGTHIVDVLQAHYRHPLFAVHDLLEFYLAFDTHSLTRLQTTIEEAAWCDDADLERHGVGSTAGHLQAKQGELTLTDGVEQAT